MHNEAFTDKCAGSEISDWVTVRSVTLTDILFNRDIWNVLIP